MYWTYVNGSVVSNSARWTPALGGPGTYQVSVFVPRCNGTSQQAKYRIVHNGVTDVRSVNQNVYYDAWVSLGELHVRGQRRRVRRAHRRDRRVLHHPPPARGRRHPLDPAVRGRKTMGSTRLRLLTLCLAALGTPAVLVSQSATATGPRGRPGRSRIDSADAALRPRPGPRPHGCGAALHARRRRELGRPEPRAGAWQA